MPVQFGRLKIQFAVRDAVKDKSGVLCECMELKSCSPSWAEVDDDAGRAGCFTERQPRRGLAGDGETPETSSSKDPCERTPIANERAQVSSLHAQTHPRCSAPVARTIHSPLSR